MNDKRQDLKDSEYLLRSEIRLLNKKLREQNHAHENYNNWQENLENRKKDLEKIILKRFKVNIAGWIHSLKKEFIMYYATDRMLTALEEPEQEKIIASWYKKIFNDDTIKIIIRDLEKFKGYVKAKDKKIKELNKELEKLKKTFTVTDKLLEIEKQSSFNEGRIECLKEYFKMNPDRQKRIKEHFLKRY